MKSKGLEIEVKFRLRSGQREAIERMVAEREPERLEQIDRYFDAGKRVLRLRKEESEWLLTRKDEPTLAPDGTKVRHEVEVPVPEAFVQELDDLLVWLGHRRLTEVHKLRESYDLGGVTLTLDRIEGLDDDFAELEVLAADESAKDRLGAVRARLGLSDDQVVLDSYAKLVAQARGEDSLGKE